jgi:hypothetical protein
MGASHGTCRSQDFTRLRRTVRPLQRIYVCMRALYLLLTLTLGVAALAQETPHWEAFLGYSNQQTDATGSGVMLHGGHFSLTENVNSWFGGMLDVSGHFRDDHGAFVDTETIAYGPQFTWRKFPSFTPSAHVALGIARTSDGFLGVPNSRIDFAVVAGGALDVPLGKRFAFRVLQADWIGTRFEDPSIRHNIRLSTGLQFRFFGYDPY